MLFVQMLLFYYWVKFNNNNHVLLKSFKNQQLFKQITNWARYLFSYIKEKMWYLIRSGDFILLFKIFLSLPPDSNMLLTMNIVWVIKRFGATPNDRKRGSYVWCSRRVRELHRVTVDGVCQQLGVHTRHAALDVELTHKARLYDELLKQ